MGIQLTMTGERQRKSFTARQKLEILREWESTGNEWMFHGNMGFIP